MILILFMNDGKKTAMLLTKEYVKLCHEVRVLVRKEKMELAV